MLSRRSSVLLMGVLFVVLGYYAANARPRWARQSYYALTHLLGRAEGCEFAESITLELSDGLQTKMAEIAAASTSIPARQAGILRWQTPYGEFWAPVGTSVPFLLAEQSLALYGEADLGVNPGDIVLDCGANVGTFAREALESTAEKVIAIEPSPRNAYCLRQTFREEISDGRVIVVEAALWHESGTMEMTVFDNSALDSLVMSDRDESNSRGTTIEVPLTTIDAVVSDLGLQRVDFIKMDIEGAERNALRAAAGTLRRHQPRLSVATENLQDDIRAIPEVIFATVPSYSQTNGGCRMIRFMTLRPEVVHFVPPKS